MTPAARIAAAIELLDAIDRSRTPTDALLAEYFKARRYVGGKDRPAIAETVYAVLRRRGQLDWWIDRTGWRVLTTTRGRMVAHLVLDRGERAGRLPHLLDGERFHPARLTPDEAMLAQALDGASLDHPDQPVWVRANYPLWLHEPLVAAFGAAVEREMLALDQPAPLDLRVNRLKATREQAMAALAGDGIAAEPTPWSPLGLRLNRRVALQTVAAWRDGLVEVQDEGSQIVALLADARPGMRVVDFCAGAGGKTLALAAGMDNRGHLLAADVSARRLEGATRRLRRAGVHNVERKVLESERDRWVKRHALGFDRVLADVPCTGTGAWRRNPDGRWRLTPSDLAELVDLQARIVESAWRLVKPGGRLAYATCSVLVEENEHQVRTFLAAHPEARLVPVADAWPDGVPRMTEATMTEPAATAPAGGDDGGGEGAAMLRLSPARRGTDGFFVALLERQA